MTETEWLNTFADNLSDILIDREMTQGMLSAASGVSQSAISEYINKKKIPGIRAVINIAYALDCGVDELVDFGDEIE